MSSDTATVKPGGGYVEDPNFVPNASDLRKQFNTSGLGASGDITQSSAVFDLDKAATAEQITRALDDSDPSVSSDRVLLPEGAVDPEEAKKGLLKAAKARLKNPVVVGEASPAEKAAAEEGDDKPTGKDARATDGPRAEGNGPVTAPEAPAGTAGAGSSVPAKSGADGDEKKSASKTAASKTAAAKKTASS